MRTVVLAVVLVAFAAPVAGCGRLDRDAVRTEVGKVQSASAEGMLVAREAARGRAFEGFIEIRSAELHSQVQKAEQKLDWTPAETGWNSEAQRTITLATQIQSLLEELHEHPNDRGRAARITQQLEELSKKVDDVSSKL
ncbi:MAG: hypothetical protein M3295_03695 [Chloroflexota bacterium]|nr:hypothetical protein [Chloroflexota bacterium]